MLLFRHLLQHATAFTLVLCCGWASANEFRNPANQSYVIWPNIPVVRAADLGEYTHDRKVFADLHTGSASPDEKIAALQAVDALQAHHERTALALLGRTLNVQLIGALDRQARDANARSPKLRFDFAGISPQELQRGAALDEKGLANLKAKAGRIGLVTYITYTLLEGSLVQATATLVKLDNGASQSFTVTSALPLLGDALARDIFDYFNGTRFPPHQNTLAAYEWLTAAPGHANTLVSRDVAQRYCQSQRAQLPSAEELETAEASGFYHGGITLQPTAVYHIQNGLYDTADTLEGEGRVRPNHIASVRNGYYYCIRPVAAAKPGGKRK